MDLEKAGLVICLTVFIVVGVNAAIYATLRRGTTIAQIELLRRAAQRARQPWATEDDALQELARQVATLKASQNEGSSSDPADDDHTRLPS